MNLSAKLKDGVVDISRSVYSSLPLPGVDRPVFIVGCGRSGTTILGTALSKHRHIAYLNEPDHLWTRAYPEADVWTARARARGGRLALTAADVERRKSRKLGRLFRFEAIRAGRPVLVEKLPVNNFRLDFIHRIFPDARFVHIYRNGLEVARSIEKVCQQGLAAWFGADSYKWDELAGYAAGREDTKGLPALCATDFERGLLEWRLSTGAAGEFLRRLPDGAFFRDQLRRARRRPGRDDRAHPRLHRRRRRPGGEEVRRREPGPADQQPGGPRALREGAPARGEAAGVVDGRAEGGLTRRRA
jgi:hypothetical protein